jgi:hypothetical protein
MRRIVPSLIAIAAASFAVPVLAADWDDGGGDLRDGYPTDWQMPGDVLNFEIGVRYWYALGTQSITAFGDEFSSSDQSHIIEAHVSIEDDASSTYVKGLAGFAGLIDGTFDTPTAVDADIQGGTIAYAQADFGWMPLGDDNFRIGGVAGYQYWNDSPSMGRATFTTATGGDSEENSFDIQSLRLGITSQFDFNDKFDLSAEVVGVPFAWVQGTFGAHDVPNIVVGPNTFQKSSATTVNGRLWGGQAQILFGLHPTDKLTVRVGGRAWYLTGPVEATFTMANVANPAEQQNFVGELDDFSLMRYGPVAELSYRF